MVETEAGSQSNRSDSDEDLIQDCFSCKIIGASACFGISIYLFSMYNKFGKSIAAKSGITFFAAGNEMIYDL